MGPLLPPGVASAEEFGDPAGAELLPAEAALVERALPVRRNEFTTVRMCARRALGQLGLPPVALLPGPHGAPRWPAGVVGSMTHCRGYRGAALGWRRDFAAVGIDAEPAEPLPAGVLETIARPAERAHIARLLHDRPAVAWDRLLFSAKESVYKATYPGTGLRLGFEDAAITVDPLRGTFRARFTVPAPLLGGHHRSGLDGRWSAAGGLLLTAIVLPAGP